MAVIDIQGFIDKLNNGEIDLDTIEAIVNANELVTPTRLNGNVNTWFGIQAALSAATGLIYTSKSAMDAAPGTKVGQAGRVTEGPDAGLYLWSGSAWVKTVDPITATRDATNSVFVPGERGGIASAAPTAAQAVIYDISIHNARRGKEYHVDYIQNQAQDVSPVGDGDGITIIEVDAGTWDNSVQAIGRLIPVTINRDTDKQFIHIESTAIPGLSVSLLINPKALPPEGTAIRMSASGDAGYSWKISPTAYQYSDRPYIDQFSSLTTNSTTLYPFVPKKRNNVEPVTPDATADAWMKAILDVRIENTAPGMLYSITGAYAPTHPTYPCALIINEADAIDYETSNTVRRMITYTDPVPPYTANTGIQTILLQSPRAQYKDVQIYITLDTDKLPAQTFLADNPDQSGYAYIISPDRYTIKPPAEKIEGSDMQLEGMGSNAIFATFNRDSAYDFEVLMQPNGANGLFNFRATHAINRADGARTELMQTNSDMVPPMQVLSNESNVDTIPPDQPQAGYTGGNHTSDGGTGGTPTAMMESIELVRDGLPVDGTKAFKAGATEYRVRWINKVMAWNTKVLGRYVLDQIVTAVIRKGTVEIWCKVVALENITVSVDNGLQSFASGFDDILFYNGANKTSRVAITSGLTSGPFANTGAGCFAASLKGDAAAGLQTIWYDREFGVGDGSHIGGTAGRFRVNGAKLYAAMMTGTKPLTMAAGESYEWHMGISWSGLEGFTGIDSAVTAYVNNEPTLMYAKLDSADGTIRAPEGAIINGQTVGPSGYTTSEPAGAYMYAINDAKALDAVNQAVSIANQYTDTTALETGEAANQYTDEVVVGIAPAVYPDNDNWATVTRNDSGQVVHGTKKDGSTWGGRNGIYEKLYDPADMDQAKADIADLQNGSPAAAEANTMRDMVNDLMNPNMDVCIVVCGASVEWGHTLPENTEPSTGGQTLASIRNNMTAPTYVNLMHKGFAHGFLDLADDYVPTLEDAPGATEGGGGAISYQDPYQFTDPRFSKYVTLYSAGGLVLERTGGPVTGANVPSPLIIPPGAFLEFEMRGTAFELLYEKTTVGGNFEIIIDNASSGEVSYTGTASWGNSLPISSLPVGLHTVRIKNNGTGDFRLEQIKRTKTFRLVNQGVSGSGLFQWRVDSPAPGWAFSTKCLTPDASYAIINLGSNDRARTETPVNISRMKEQKRGIIQYFTSQGVKSILGGSAPIGPDFPNVGSTAKVSQLQIGRMNRELAAEEGVSCLDRYVRSIPGRWISAEEEADYWYKGVNPGDNHPNAVGHRWQFNAYWEQIVKYVDFNLG